MYEVDLVWVSRGWEVPIISFSMSPVMRTPLKILRLAQPLLEWWYGTVLHPKGHPPHIKHDKHLLYVWSGSGVSMKCEVDGGSQSYPTACPQWEPHSKSYDWPNPFWSDGIVWCCGIMTASHGWRLLNTFYRYEVDLVWVWSGWEVPIISYSICPQWEPHSKSYDTGPTPFGVMV